MYYVYVIKNDSGKSYTGHTGNITQRIRRHNQQLPNKKSSYTSKNKGRWRLVYSETFNNRNEAMQRERFLKSGQGRELLKQLVDSR